MNRSAVFNGFTNIFPFVIGQSIYFTTSDFGKVMNAGKLEQRCDAIKETHQ